MATLKGYIPHGDPIGVDGKPRHVLDRKLVFDPESGRFSHHVLSGDKGGYWMNSVGIVRQGLFYMVAINLAQADGTVNQFGSGAVFVFQTHPRGKPRRLPIMRKGVSFENGPGRFPR